MMETERVVDLASWVKSQRERWSVERSLEVFRQIAARVGTLHRQGLLHRHIALDTIRIDPTSGAASLDDPPAVVSLGGTLADPDLTPPEHRREKALDVPSNHDDARRAFRSAAWPGDPIRIDVYQLSVVLCRLLTGGKGLSEYHRSPRVQVSVPAQLREVLDRALGSPGQDRQDSLTELVREIDRCRTVSVQAVDSETPPDRDSHNGEQGSAAVSPQAAGNSLQPASKVEPRRPDARGDSPYEGPYEWLGHYRVMKLLGRGGMGDVYLAFEEQLNRQVAIKVLPPEMSRHGDFVQRFRAEASAAARLSHPAIVPIYFIGEDQGAHFFVMQYIEGESLADILNRRGSLPWEEAVAFIEQILGGLGVAHAQGLVHRDIKPGNLLWDRQRQSAVLADFGVAKAIHASAGLTATGTVLGTADYFSPEQGRGLNVDQRSDLYAIGCVLYRMLSGKLPFQGDSSTSLIFQHVYEPPPPLTGVAPQVPERVAKIVHRLMNKNPDDRYPDAAAVLTALRQLREPESSRPVEANSASPVEAAPGQPSPAVMPTPYPTTLEYAASDDWEKPVRMHVGTSSGAGRGLVDRLLGLLRSQTPGLLARLQNTQQQVDGAIVEYERREAALRTLTNEAEQVHSDLLAREVQQRTDVNRGRQKRDGASQAQRSLREMELASLERGLTEVVDLRRQQEAEFEKLKAQLAKVSARVRSMRAERDILNARLRAIEISQPELHTQHTQGRTRWAVALCAGAVLLGVFAWRALGPVTGNGEESDSPKKISELNAVGPPAKPPVKPEQAPEPAPVVALNAAPQASMKTAGSKSKKMSRKEPASDAPRSEPKPKPVPQTPVAEVVAMAPQPKVVPAAALLEEQFTGRKYDSSRWSVSRSVHSRVNFNQDRLHVVIPPGNTGFSQAAMKSRFRLQGNFDIRADFDAQSFPRPKAESANLAIVINGPGGVAATAIAHHAQGGMGYSLRYEPLSGGQTQNWRSIVGTERNGSLRMQRTGGRVRFLAAGAGSGTGQSFQEIGEVEYGTAPIEMVAFLAVAPQLDSVLDAGFDNVLVIADRIETNESNAESTQERPLNTTVAAAPAPPVQVPLADEAEKQFARQLLQRNIKTDVRTPRGVGPLDQSTDIDSGLFSVRFVALESGTPFSTADYASLAKLPRFEKLNAMRVPLTDADLANLAKSKSLQELALWHTQVTPQGLEVLQEVRTLRDLNLGGERYGDNELHALAKLDQLRSLNLSYTRITDAGLKHLVPLAALESLCLNERSISDQALVKLPAMLNLSNMLMECKPFTGEAYRDLKFPNMRSLWIANSGLTDLGMKRIAEACPNIGAMDISNTGISDAALVAVHSLQKLQALNLGKTRITDKGLAALSAMPDLTQLTLTETGITDKGLPTLVTAVPKLRSLVLRKVDITDAGLSSLRGHATVETLYLEGTQVSMESRETFKSMPDLRDLHLSKSRVSESEAAELRRELPKLNVTLADWNR